MVATTTSNKISREIDTAYKNKFIWSSLQASRNRAAHHIEFLKVTATNCNKFPAESFNLLAANSAYNEGLITLWYL